MNKAGCLLLLTIGSQICHSTPVLQEPKARFRRAPADDEDEPAAPVQDSSAQGVLEMPPTEEPGDDDEEEDEKPTGPTAVLDYPTTAKPTARTTPQPPPTAPPARQPTQPPATTRRPAATRAPAAKGRGARIVFQPLGVVAYNALSRGLTSALMPILNNEQPTGFQYGSVPVDLSSLPEMPSPDSGGGNTSQQAASVASRGTSIVSSFMSSLWGG